MNIGTARWIVFWVCATLLCVSHAALAQQAARPTADWPAAFARALGPAEAKYVPQRTDPAVWTRWQLRWPADAER
jgi:hypothetical protein